MNETCLTRRQRLHMLLVGILGSDNVYFQPPPSLQMHYPAIVYTLSDLDSFIADDLKYLVNKSYSMIYVHKNPDDPIVDKLYALTNCRFERAYQLNNLYHKVFTIYI